MNRTYTSRTLDKNCNWTPLIDDFYERKNRVICCMLKVRVTVVHEQRVLIVSLETGRKCPWVQTLTSTFFSLTEYLTFWAGKRKKTTLSSDSLSPLKLVDSQTDKQKQLHHPFVSLCSSAESTLLISPQWNVSCYPDGCSVKGYNQLMFLYS